MPADGNNFSAYLYAVTNNFLNFGNINDIGLVDPRKLLIRQ